MKNFDLIAMVLVLGMFFSIKAYSATYTFINGGGDHLWTNPANWTCDEATCNIPMSMDDVIIDGFMVEITGSSSIIINDLDLKSTVAASSITGTDLLAVTNQMNWEAGTIDIRLQMNGSGTLNIYTTGEKILNNRMLLYGTTNHSGGDIIMNDDIINYGTYNWSGGNLIINGSGTDFFNNTTGIMTISNDVKAQSDYQNFERFLNIGQCTVTAAVSTLSFELAFENAGVFINETSGDLIFEESFFIPQTGLYKGLSNNILNSNFNVQGTISPGLSPGQLTFNKFTAAANSPIIVDIEIATNDGAGIGHDQLTITETAALNGTLNVSLLNGFNPTQGDSYTIINCPNGYTGTFSTINLPNSDWDIEYLANEVVVGKLCKQSELDALIAIYNTTDGDNWINNNNWDITTTDPCKPCLDDWHGIICENGKITKLLLNNNNLSGSLPASIGNFSNVIEIDLRTNAISGAIPSEIGNLTKLETLYLFNTDVGGNIPTTFAQLSNLKALFINLNELTGIIPSELSSLSELVSLNLSDNNLVGNIPIELTDLSKLEVLALHGNDLEGSIPPEIGNMTTLEYLSLYFNELTGEIPSELGDLTNLISLDLKGNNLTGEIPSELSNLSNLEVLNLAINQLSGRLPKELGSLTLNTFNLSQNELEGCFPESYESFCGLSLANSVFASGFDFRFNTDLLGEAAFDTFMGFCDNGTYSCPINDDCIDATIIPINGTATGTNENAMNGPLPPGSNPICYQGGVYQGGEIWFKFTTPNCTDPPNIELGLNSSAFNDTRVVIYSSDGDCTTTSVFACGNNTNGTGPFELLGNDHTYACNATYYVSVFDAQNNDFGEVELYVDCDNCDVLPLELVDFSGTAQEHFNLLQWSTATEKDIAYFQIERFQDGHDWQSLDKVFPKGNTSTRQFYQAMDNQPFSNTFYRLRILENSGKEEFSDLINVQRKRTTYLDIIPNPASDIIYLNTPNDKLGIITINDVLGQIIWEGVIENGQYELNVSNWKSGVYCVSVHLGSKRKTKRLIIQ